MAKRLQLMLPLLLGMSTQLWAAASLTLYPVRFDFTSARSDSVLRITNNSPDVVTLQARVYRWRFDDHGDVLTLTDDVITNPPMATLKPKGEQILRLGLRSVTANGREASYRLIIEEVPSRKHAPATSLNTRLRVSLPIFVSDHDHLPPSLQWTIQRVQTGALKLVATNYGDTHIRIDTLRVYSGENRDAASNFDPPEYVLPGQRREWDLMIPPPSVSTEWTIEAHTDAGKLQQAIKESGN